MVTKSHSRPHVSNDNPYSETQFQDPHVSAVLSRALGSVEDSRGACGDFFHWHNLEHCHSGLGLLTPHDVHHGLAKARVDARAATLAGAFREHPERFPRGLPQPPALPTEAWINKPKALAAPAAFAPSRKALLPRKETLAIGGARNAARAH